MYKFVKTPV